MKIVPLLLIAAVLIAGCIQQPEHEFQIPIAVPLFMEVAWSSGEVSLLIQGNGTVSYLINGEVQGKPIGVSEKVALQLAQAFYRDGFFDLPATVPCESTPYTLTYKDFNREHTVTYGDCLPPELEEVDDRLASLRGAAKP